MQIFEWMSFKPVPEISAQQLHKQLKESEPPQLLDVRTRIEWQLSHIAGATNIPITQLHRQIASLDFDKNKAVVAICLSAHRSRPAVDLLRSSGFRNVMQLKRGMLAWWLHKLPTSKG